MNLYRFQVSLTCSEAAYTIEYMEEKYEYIVNTSKDFITLIDRNYTYTIVNDSYCTAIGKDKKDILNKTVSEVWGNERFDTTLKNYLDKCFSGKEIHYVEKFKFGEDQRYMHVSYYPYYDDKRVEVTHVCVFSHDITKLGEIESKLINYEYRDPVTGLFNRRSLEIILDMELEKAKRSEHENLRGILYIGIENLTTISRQHGHSIGNILLENAGVKVKEVLRQSDYVFRYEGNELVVILSRLARSTDAAKVAEKILEALSAPYNYRDFSIVLDCYIGISIYPDDGEDRESILGHAISALGEAKAQKKHYILFNPEIHKQAIHKLELERDLQKAFHNREFTLHYQPIVDKEGGIIGAEALIRWNHPSLGFISPGQFIPLAEETGMVKEIGKWALFTATKQVKQWLELSKLYVSINLSAPEFSNSLLIEIVQSALRQADDLDPGCLKLEITETQGMMFPEKSIDRMEKMKELGIQIYIDDFGTGQSSLNYLKRLPAEVLKIDKIFVEEIVENLNELSFLENIIALAKRRGKKIIIEGVSDRGKYLRLKEMDCDAMQGFYFAKPLPPEEFEKLLREGGTLPKEKGMQS